MHQKNIHFSSIDIPVRLSEATNTLNEYQIKTDTTQLRENPDLIFLWTFKLWFF